MPERRSATDHLHTLQEIIELARRRLTDTHWNYLAGASDSETSPRRNRLALDSLAFRPRILNDVSQVDSSGSFLGHRLRMPVLLPPIGSSQLFHHSGGVAAASAAAEFGVASFLSSHSEPDLETVAKAAESPKIFQLYLAGDEGWMNEYVQRVVAAGYVGFCLTADTQVPSRRERDWLKRWSLPSTRLAGDFGYQAKMSWKTIERFKERFAIPLVLKGVASAADARRACDLGVDVIYVSNHGGRQLDHSLGTASMLPQVVEAVDGRAEVVFDGGILRGTDVVKAMAMGANAVACGRLFVFGMAAAGAAGIVRVLEILEHEVRNTLASLGLTSFAELSPEVLVSVPPLPDPVGESHLTRAFPHFALERPRF